MATTNNTVIRADLDTLLGVLEMAYFEAKIAFEGLKDENVWKRPTQSLLSVGELAGHIAYWEAIRLAGEGRDLTKCRINSLLIDSKFAYYSNAIATSPSEQHLAMNAEEVCQELFRVHEVAIADFQACNPSLESTAPGWSANSTYGELLKYAAFHIAYHTGQMYSARHLLGELTTDN